MIPELLYTRRAVAAILLAGLFALASACGSEPASPGGGGTDDVTAEAEHPPSSPTAESTATAMATEISAPAIATSVMTDDEELAPADHPAESTGDSSTMAMEDDEAAPAAATVTAVIEPTADNTPVIAPPALESTEPVLVNTPGPVANLAPDFTLPSVQGVDYTLSQFRGERPVVVVFYRAYW